MKDQASIKRIGGHPVGLFYLFFAELWERFSFYGMRALLTLYLATEIFVELGTKDADEKAIGVYAAYGALVYATPLLGGFLADKVMGFRRAIILGGVLMAIGHFVMVIENDAALYLALGFLIMGNGFFKPNISSFVGDLYEEKDINRDAGFTIFYLGINLGAFFAPLICGYLGHNYGWHYGFGLAGIGMVIGLLVFLFGLKSGVFGNEGLQPTYFKENKYAGLNINHFISIAALLLIPIFAILVAFNDLAVFQTDLMGVVVALTFISATIGTIIIMIQVGWQAAKKILVIVFITFLLTIFWAFYEQGGTSLTLFAERNVDLLFGLTASQTNSFSAFGILIFSLPFAFMWSFLNKINRNPSTPLKYAIGLGILGFGFLLFAISPHFMSEQGQVPMLFLMGGYLCLTTGELFVSPIGLSKVTELSPKKSVAFFMGIFFLSLMGAFYVGGYIAKLTAGGGESEARDLGAFWGPIVEKITGFPNGVSDSAVEGVRSLATYSSLFAQVAVFTFGVAFLALIMTPIIKWLMQDVK